MAFKIDLDASNYSDVLFGFFFYHNKIHPLTNYKAIKNLKAIKLLKILKL